MVLFAYFFIPQIFFYGMDSLLGAILNTRGRFGANMWTPVINNVVVILVGGAVHRSRSGLHRTPQTISPAPAIKLLGIGTTAGHPDPVDRAVPGAAPGRVQHAAAGGPAARRDQRDRPDGRLDAGLRGLAVGGEPGRAAGRQPAAAHGATGDGYSAYSYAWSLFQLPYAVVGISVISALLPRMSGHATDRRYSKVREDFSTGVRLASVIVVPAAVFLAVLGPPLCEFLFSYGSTRPPTPGTSARCSACSPSAWCRSC